MKRAWQRDWSGSVAGMCVVAVSVLALSGCGFFARATAEAGTAVKHFHEQLNAEQYEEILSQADAGFTGSQSHEQLVKFLSAIHRKLGNAGESKLTGYRVNYNTGGVFTTVSYTTSYASGPADETFVWVKSGDKLKLYSYHISSMALITS
jgi:hypothetical protein